MNWKDEFTRGFVFAMSCELRATHRNDGMPDDRAWSDALSEGEAFHNNVMYCREIPIIDMKTGLTYVYPEVAKLLKHAGINWQGDYIVWVNKILRK